MSSNDYSKEAWGEGWHAHPSNNFLEENEDGTFLRISFFDDEGVFLETYDADFNFVSSRQLTKGIWTARGYFKGMFAGILCFFLDSLSAGGMAGNLLAVFSGFTYALVMMMKGFPGADFESSLLASHVISLSIGLPSFLGETDHSAKAWICIILLGVIQFGLSYIFLSRGLDRVSPVTASLTSTLEPILNPILVAIFCGETIGRTAVIGAVLVIGAAACYNVYEAAHKD